MKRSIWLITLALMVNTAFAADKSFYIYGSVGITESDRKAEVDAVITNLGITAFTSQADDKDSGLKLQFGWQVNQNFAIEGGYIDLGKFTYHADATAPIVATRDGTAEISSWNIGVVASAPVSDNLALSVKAGVLAYNLDYHCQGTGIACPNPERSDDGTPPYYGVGINWQMSKDWFMQADYEVFTDIGEKLNSTGSTGTTQSDVTMLSVGVGYRF